MSFPKCDSAILENCRRLEIYYLSIGLGRWKALKKIGDAYGVSSQTIYSWLTPAYKAHALELTKSEKYKIKKRDWAKRPENRVKLSEYSKKYQFYRKHLDSYIQELFWEQGAGPLTLLSISQKLREKTNIIFNKKFILGAIAKYNYEHDNSPIEEIEPDYYQMKL